jgi:signal transduction histidine kinase
MSIHSTSIDRPKSDMTSAAPLNNRLPPHVVGLFLGFILLIAIVVAAGWFVFLQDYDSAAARRTLEIQNAISRSFSLVQDAETSQRGFLLIGQPAYLAPFDEAEAQIDGQLDRLGRLIGDDPEQQKNLSSLRPIVEAKRAELQRTVDLRKSGDLDAALAIVRDGRGKDMMDRIREIVDRMERAQEEYLPARIEQTRRNGYALQAAVILAASLALLLGLLSVFYLRHHLAENNQAFEKLSAANERLAREAVERDRLEAQLRQAQKMEIVGQLTGGIAHDFNNMLAVVIGNLNLLSKRLQRGETNVERFADGALEGANRAALLTHRLLAFSRQQPLMPDIIDANRLVSGMTELLRRTLGGEVILETVLAGGLWRTHIDGSQLEIAIVNVAVNARDAMPGGGKLTIETCNAHLDEAYASAHEEVRAGQYVLVAVSDTGQGMNAQTIDRAFDPFFTTKESGKGTGLGLSQVFGFVKQSHGHVKIYSEPGEGATVKIYLPRYAGAAAELEAPQAAPFAPTGSLSEVVLVVEDDERVRRLTVDALRDLNYTVLHAESAAQALKVLDARQDIALLLTDIVMPETNGRQLAEEALRRRSDLKVLYFTGFTRNAIVHNGTLDKGMHLLTKPFTIDQLASKIREALAPALG